MGRLNQAKWLDANEDFRAVPIPAGRDRITFRYRSDTVLTGALLSALALTAIIILAISGRRRRGSSVK